MSFLGRLWHNIRVRTAGAHAYEPLGSQPNNEKYVASSWRQLLPRGKKGPLTIIFVLVILILVASWTRPLTLSFESLRILRQSIQPQAGYLHVLVNSGHAHPRFCRTALSAAMLNYPTLILTNWAGVHCDNEKFGSTEWEWGFFHGSLRYLKTIADDSPDDLVLIIDGDDSWFQLKPEVLIQRFYDMTREADRRNAHYLGTSKKKAQKSSIIFSASKTCAANDVKHIGCYAAPPPPDFSIIPTGETSEPHLSDTRPRFLTSSTIIGTASALRALHQAGYERWWPNPKTFTSRTDLFSTFFGEQSYAHMLRIPSSTSDPSSHAASVIAHPPPIHVLPPHTGEWGITLDYTSLISTPPSNTTSWLTYSNPSALSTALSAHNLTASSPGAKTPPLDTTVSYSRPPFWSLAPRSCGNPLPYEDLPSSTPWTSIPLFSSLSPLSAPALLTHSSLDSNSPHLNPEEIDTKWGAMWYHPYLRKKLQNYAYEPTIPIGTTVTPLFASFNASSTSTANSTAAKLVRLVQKLKISPGGLAGRGTVSGKRHARPLGEKQFWSPVAISPVDKSREGFGFVIIDHDGREWWKRWAEECRNEEDGGKEDQEEEEKDKQGERVGKMKIEGPGGMQAGIFGDGGAGWRDEKVFPPFKLEGEI